MSTFFALRGDVFATGDTVYTGRGPSCSWAERHASGADHPNLWHVHERRPALMDGKPAVLSRKHLATVDDFGTLVEVSA